MNNTSITKQKIVVNCESSSKSNHFFKITKFLLKTLRLPKTIKNANLVRVIMIFVLID